MRSWRGTKVWEIAYTHIDHIDLEIMTSFLYAHRILARILVHIGKCPVPEGLLLIYSPVQKYIPTQEHSENYNISFSQKHFASILLNPLKAI